MTERVFSQTFGAVGGILEREGKILLIKEAGSKHADIGKWSHPAGWIDVGEDPVKAAKREVEEESGYKFEPTALLGIYSLVRNDITDPQRGTPHAIKLIFVGDISDTQELQTADDSAEVRWFSPDEIEAMDGNTLRDKDIKQMIKDYLNGQRFPLDVINHSFGK